MKASENMDITKFNTISFALEGVLTDEFNGDNNPYKEEMQNLLKECFKHDKKVTIFSRRYSPETETYKSAGYSKAKKLNDKNKNEHIFSDKLIREIIGDNTVTVIYSNREPFFYSMDSRFSNHCHFDSSDFEKVLINENFGDLIKVFNITKDNYNEN